MMTIEEPNRTIHRLHAHMAGKGMIVGRTVNRRLFDGLARRFHIDVGWSTGEVRMRAYKGGEELIDSFDLTDDNAFHEATSWIDNVVNEFLYREGVVGREAPDVDAPEIEDLP